MMVSIISNLLIPFYITIKIRQTSKGKTKCRLHGGRGTGSRTPEGKARQIAANTKHVNETRAQREECTLSPRVQNPAAVCLADFSNERATGQKDFYLTLLLVQLAIAFLILLYSYYDHCLNLLLYGLGPYIGVSAPNSRAPKSGASPLKSSVMPGNIAPRSIAAEPLRSRKSRSAAL